jgi:hypothetical protein
MLIWLWPSRSLTILGVHALAEQQRGAAMAQVVEADAGQASASKQWKEAPLPQVVGVERLAGEVGEDQAVLLPTASLLLAFGGLPGAMVGQRGCGELREQHGSAWLAVFELPDQLQPAAL